MAQWLACWAHNPKDRGSIPRSATSLVCGNASAESGFFHICWRPSLSFFEFAHGLGYWRQRNSDFFDTRKELRSVEVLDFLKL